MNLETLELVLEQLTAIHDYPASKTRRELELAIADIKTKARFCLTEIKKDETRKP